jgi:putative tricarboxylic transport membrane protein
MVSGLIMLGAIVTQHSPMTLSDVTPIARLTGEYEILAVPVASPFQTLDDLIRVFKERPESISWGGGSAGGSDQILAGLIADAVGVAPSRVNYIAFSGGGESLSAILGGQVSVGINGLAEFMPQIEAGSVRVLAISSAERLTGLNVPTLREQGVDVEFENWRSIVAAPGLTPAQRQQLVSLVEKMVMSAEWRETLERFRWIDRFLAGNAYEQFVDSEEARVQDILRKLGTSAPESESTGTYPMIVLVGLALSGVAAAAGGIRRPAVAGPRADVAPGWPSLGLIAVGIVLDVLLAERAGFVIASTALFWFVARAFDERHPVRDAICAVAISTGAYLLFDRVLDLQLPSGVLGF